LRLVPSHDYTFSLRRARGQRCDGTCDWLLQRPEFREWIKLRGAKHLWCYGIRTLSLDYTGLLDCCISYWLL
jgi:phage major head subunit gpT-like protein